MLISEVMVDEGGETVRTFEQLEHIVESLEGDRGAASVEVASDIRQLIASLPSELSEHQRLHLWKLSYRIWNVAVDLTNNMQSDEGLTVVHVRLRHTAAEMLLTAGENPNVSSSLVKMAMFFNKTGTLWHQLKNYEMAEACYSQAMELSAQARDAYASMEKGQPSAGKDIYLLTFDIYTSRAQTAWELGQHALACNLLGRANSTLPSVPEKAVELAEQYLSYGRLLLSKSGDIEAASESVAYFEEAFEICSGGTRAQADSSALTSAHLEQLASLKLKTLRYLAGAHIQNQQHDAALKCIATLKTTSDHPSIPFLELKALVGSGRCDEAGQALDVLVSHQGCSVELTAAGIEALLDSKHPDTVQHAKSAFVKMQHRFPKSKKLPLLMLEKLLKKSPTTDRIKAAIEIAQTPEVIALLGNEQAGASAQEQQCVYALLWSEASSLFQSKDYDLSRQVFEATMLYSSGSQSATAQRAKTLRLLCLCHLATEQLEQAQECVNLAEQLDPTIATCFLKFKIFLRLNNVDEASKQLEQMVTCQDFDPEYLTLAAHEAISSKCGKVAVAALSNLLKVISTSQSTGTSEVVVLRNIISLTCEQDEGPLASIEHFKNAQSRLKDSGYEAFFGQGATARKEATWFAGMAWNLGLEAASSKQWEGCASFWLCSADFYAALPETVETLSSQARCLILAAAALLSCIRGSSDTVELKAASTCLDRCRKVFAVQSSKSDSSAVDDNLRTYFNLLLFDVKSRARDTQAQLEILQRCKGIPGFSPELFLKMAVTAGDRGGSNIEVAITALRACLNRLLSSASPDYAMAACVIRRLIRLADQQDKDGEQVLDLYKEAEKMLVGLPEGTYPQEELHWLVSTAWNRAPLHAKFRRFHEAEVWMKIALDLMKHAPGLKVHKKMMLEAFEEVAACKDKMAAMEE